MEQSPEVLWNACLEVIRANISSPQSFKTWFGPIKPVSVEREGEVVKLTVELPSQFYYEWLEEHYFKLLRKTITKVLGPTGRLYYKVVIEKEDREAGHSGASMQLPAKPGAPSQGGTVRPQQPPPAATPRPGAESSGSAGPSGTRPPADPARRAPGRPGAAVAARPSPSASPPQAHPFALPGIQKAPVDSNLNGTYVFDRFIEGDCNRLARSAALAIGAQPGRTSFNPFLVYGGVGLGKTHLIQAIGNFALEHGQATSVLYVSSERFTNEFVQSIKQNRAAEFSLFYRSVDVLIVDDIQFFEGKERTQEEFFHIFNALHQSGKQIVLSSDRPPKEIQGIENRLLSRFQWGLSADIKAPELETRVAILERKAEDEGIDLSQEVIEFIAHNIKSNIRELEGALIRLLANATLQKRELDVNLAREVLHDLIQDAPVSITVEEIQRTVAAFFGVQDHLLRDKTRKREIVQARQIAMYFAKQFTQHSLKNIGLHFGGRDHSTVIHATQSVENQIDTDERVRDSIETLRRRLELRSRGR